MDPTRDNPIIRFNTFWWALWAFFAFAIALALVMIFNRKAPTNLEDAAAAARYQTQRTVNEAQHKELPAAEIDKVIPEVAARLAATVPAAVERPEQAVPGTATANQLLAEPALGPTAPPAPTPPPATEASAPATPPVTDTPAPATPPATDTPAPATPPATGTPKPPNP